MCSIFAQYIGLGSRLRAPVADGTLVFVAVGKQGSAKRGPAAFAVAVSSAAGYHNGVNRRTLKIAFVFASCLWGLCISVVGYYVFLRESKGPWPFFLILSFTFSALAGLARVKLKDLSAH